MDTPTPAVDAPLEAQHGVNQTPREVQDSVKELQTLLYARPRAHGAAAAADDGAPEEPGPTRRRHDAVLGVYKRVVLLQLLASVVRNAFVRAAAGGGAGEKQQRAGSGPVLRPARMTAVARSLARGGEMGKMLVLQDEFHRRIFEGARGISDTF